MTSRKVERTYERLKISSTGSKDLKNQDTELIGETIAGKYLVLELLGTGRSGTVYLVEFVPGTLGEKFAMKILRENISREPYCRDQFINTIRRAMRLVNRYIVQVRDVGSTADGLLYYTMDYCPGKTLAAILDRGGALPVTVALSLVRKVLRALDSAHSLGMSLRGIEPSKILVARSGDHRTVKVLGFGMPPASSDGNAFIDNDLHDVAVVLYESITGVKPYPETIASNHDVEPSRPELPEKFRPEVRDYPGLSQLVMKSLEAATKTRFQTAREFIRAIQTVLKDSTPEPEATGREPRARARPTRPVTARYALTRHHGTTIAVLLGILLYVVLFGAPMRQMFIEEQNLESYFDFLLRTVLFVVMYALLVAVWKALYPWLHTAIQKEIEDG